MNNIIVKTLTPVHIGSGVFLHNMTDFINYFNEKEDNLLGIIDEKKIMNLIGYNHIEEWVAIIERGGNIKSIIQKYAPGTHQSSYVKRTILNFYNEISPSTTLKECLHNGMGFPYIPGSSIKGAIRTVILTSLIHSSHLLNNNDSTKSLKEYDRKIEQNLLGNEPNKDFFRFIQVGDAYFPRECEIAIRMINLNIRERNKSLIDQTKSQLIECICPEVKAEIHLKINEKQAEFCHNKNQEINLIPSNYANIDSLFKIINTHTNNLIGDEIKFWNEVGETKIGAENYVKNIEKIKDLIDINDTKKCILRIGHGSGWRFITGGWPEKFRNFNSQIIPKCRPKNFLYANYDFPKTRRIDEESDILGFVQLIQKEN